MSSEALMSDGAQRPSIRHRLEFALYWAVQHMLRRMSWEGASELGMQAGKLFHAIDARHRRVVRDNLRQADLGLDELQIRQTARECFAHFGSLLFGGIRMMDADADELNARIQIEGLEHWDAAAAEGRGFVGLTGHYGNWEAMALFLSLHGRPLAVIGRELDNPLLEPHMRAIRGRFGNKVVPKRGAMKEAVKLLREGWGIGFLLDQNAGLPGIWTRFMGRWASTHFAAATLALKYDLPIVPIFSFPKPDGCVGIEVKRPFHPPRSGHAERDIWVATQLMTWCIEARIRKDPQYWFWMHRRWKTPVDRPDVNPLPPEDWQREAERLWEQMKDDHGK